MRMKAQLVFSIRTQSFSIDNSDSEEDEDEIGCRHESANLIEDETETFLIGLWR